MSFVLISFFVAAAALAMGFTEGNTSPAVLKAAGGLILFISFLSFIGACVYYNVSEEKIEDSNNDDEMYCDARGRNQTARRLQDSVFVARGVGRVPE